MQLNDYQIIFVTLQQGNVLECAKFTTVSSQIHIFLNHVPLFPWWKLYDQF